MSELINSKTHSECFACGENNALGLKLKFQSAGYHQVYAECVLGEEYQGYQGVLQGGVISTLLDSAMTNCLFADGVSAMTVCLNVRFREPVLINREINVTASFVSKHGRLYELEAELMQDGKVKAYAQGKFLKEQHVH